MNTSEPVWAAVAETIAHWGLARTVRTEKDPANPGRILELREIRALSPAEDFDFRRACEQIVQSAERAGVEPVGLAHEVASAIKKGAQRAAAIGAKRAGRLPPDERKEYRKRAAQARGLAQWLAHEINERQVPQFVDGAIRHTFTEGDYEAPEAFADLLLPLAWTPIKATPTGATIEHPGLAGSLPRVVDAINNLHWLANILQGDVKRSRPQGAASATWKPTASLLRELFEQRLGEPLLTVAGALAGLAHQCEVPLAELSRLSKP